MAQNEDDLVKAASFAVDGPVVSDDIVKDARIIIEAAQGQAQHAVNALLVRRNWLLGKRIAEEDLASSNKDGYGKEIIVNLSKQLTDLYGKGFTKSNLYSFVSFYKCFPEIFHAVRGKSSNLLSWTHYRSLLQVADEDERNWYANEAANQGWSTRTLQRNIATQYYGRLLSTKIKDKQQSSEPMVLADEEKVSKLEFMKNPVMAEFLGISANEPFREATLEGAIIANLQKFLMEMGKGYAFVARQQRIQADDHDYFIDLVFYNYILKCFVLVDLKAGEITHQDIGQMDMYVRMYDERQKGESDNPTLGLILCSKTNADVMHYSVLNDKDQLFAAKYMLYVPSDDVLRAEIESQKAMFELRQVEGCGFLSEDSAIGKADNL